MAAHFLMPTYDAQYFIEKFEKIPEEMWCKDHFEMDGKHCALGHCGARENIEGPPESVALSELFAYHLHRCITSVNDFRKAPFDQPNPRARILAACQLLKEQGH